MVRWLQNALMRHRHTLSGILATLALLAGCAGLAPSPLALASVSPHEVTLPRHRAWVEGRQVDYVTTDISDAAMAQALGVNHVPRLADALPAIGQRSLVERVYKFADDTQIAVFQSAPSPTGAANRDLSYSPLWRMVLVRWVAPHLPRELRSEEEVLASADRGQVSLQVTGIVINCPITRSVDGLPIKGAR